MTPEELAAQEAARRARFGGNAPGSRPGNPFGAGQSGPYIEPKGVGLGKGVEAGARSRIAADQGLGKFWAKEIKVPDINARGKLAAGARGFAKFVPAAIGFAGAQNVYDAIENPENIKSRARVVGLQPENLFDETKSLGQRALGAVGYTVGPVIRTAENIGNTLTFGAAEKFGSWLADKFGGPDIDITAPTTAESLGIKRPTPTKKPVSAATDEGPYLKPGVYGNDPARPITVTDENGTQVVRGPAIRRPQNTTITYAQEPDYLEPVFYKGKQVGEKLVEGRPAYSVDVGTSGNEGADVPDRWAPYKINPLEQRKFDFEVGKYTNAQRIAGNEARAAFIAAIQEQVGDLDKLAAGAIANAAWSNNPNDEAMAYNEAYKLLKEYQDKQ